MSIRASRLPEGRHGGVGDAVLDEVVKLTVGVQRHVNRQVERRRVESGRQRAIAQAARTVATDAVGLEQHASGVDRLLLGRNWIAGAGSARSERGGRD